MITELQWRYAEHHRNEELTRWAYDLPWYALEFYNVEAAFIDMERRAAEQAWYDRHEAPAEYMDPNHFENHHHKPEPVQYYKICTDKITELLA